MKFKKKIIASLILTGQIYPASAALMRDDISVQVYRDFGENRGIFAPGATDVPIYHIDGSFSGTINVMPDFAASVDGGYSTLVNSQVTATAKHVDYNDSISFAKRYQQLDATLFSGAENASSYTLMNEVTKRAYEIDAGGDYKITRERTLVTDVAPVELFTDTSQFKPGLVIARVGGGSLAIATAVGKANYIDYGPQAGGLNIITEGSFSGNVHYLGFYLPVKQITALDVGTLAGDSGSGMWGWDIVSQSWKFLGINSAGSGEGYNKYTYLRSAPEWTLATMDSFNDPAINTLNAADIIYVGAQDRATGEGDFTLNGGTIRYHGIRTDIAASALVNTDFMSNKNLILGGAGGTLQLTAPNLDLGAGSLTFNADYTLSDGGDSSRRMNSAGYIINAGATVISNLTGSIGDIWRKIGAGTLEIGGSDINHASLYAGDGLTILQRLGGHAVDALHISSGRATVRLGAADQLDGTQVGFGTRGGVLDLYGQSLSWADIIHMDNGAIIANNNANTLSTFTFTGSGPKTYLGNFVDGGAADKGLLHLVYAPGVHDSAWTLKGNVNTRGGMDILYGNLAVQGALTLHAGGFIDPTQYERSTFDLGDSLVNLTDSQFTVGRNAMARGRFVLDDASSLLVTSGGEVSSNQQGVQEGAYLDGSVDLMGVNSVLKVTPEAAFRVQINAALSGAGHIIKEGLGTLYITGANSLTGNSLISAGRVIAGSMSSLGAQPDGWTIGESGVLDMGDNAANLATILDKISDTSRGVLALDGAINSTSLMAILTKDLYLGSSTNLALGAAGQDLTTGAQDLYLGGGDGEVSIKGYLPASGSSLFLGNGQSRGTVRIESRNANWVGDIDLRHGIRLITDNEDALGNGRLDVNYGAVAGFNVFPNITSNSAGMVNITQNDTFSYDLSGFQQLALGTLAGETLVINDALAPAQTGYFFSGGGDVLINSQLENNTNLTVDAQDNAGGSVTLNQANTLNGRVTVLGYHDDVNESAKSEMTLKFGVDNAIDGHSQLVLGDGGVLDLNGHSVALNVEKSSLTSTITSSEMTNASTLNLLVDKDTALNSLISGANMHVVKTGAGTLTLSGKNTFTGDTMLSAGKTIANSDQAFGAAANIVTVAKDAMLDLNGISVLNTLDLSSGSLLNSRSGTGSLGVIQLDADSSGTFHGNSNADKFNVGRYQLNGHRLTLNNMSTELGANAFDDGDIVFNQSNVYWVGKPGILSNSSGSMTLGSGTVLELRDVNQTVGPAKTLVLDGGTIASGTDSTHYYNGGGGGATLRSAVRVDTTGTLNGSNLAFGINLGLYGPISGQGTLNIAGAQGVTFLGDTSAFTGDMVLKHSSKLYFNSPADNTFAGDISSEGTGKFVKQGTNSLTLTGDNHLYLNELDIQKGDVVMATGTSTTGGALKLSGGRLVLDSAEDMTLTHQISGSTGQMIKRGTGTANLTGSVDFSAGSDRTAIDLARGTLTNTGSIKARGTGIYVSGDAGLKNSGTLEVSGGSAVIEVADQASLDLTALSVNGTVKAKGAADGILLSKGASGLSVSGTTLDMSDSTSTGVAIHNVAGVTDIHLTDTTIKTNNGVGIYTGTTLARVNSGTINVAGGTGLLMQNTDGSATANNLDLSGSNGLTINATGAGGRGIVTNLSGTGRQVDSAVNVNINHATGGAALDVSGAQVLNQSGHLISMTGDVVRAANATSITNSGSIEAASRLLNTIVMNGGLDKTLTNSGTIKGQLNFVGGQNTVMLSNGSAIDGDIALGNGDKNRMTLKGDSNILTGDISATGNDSTVTLADGAAITGNISLGNGDNAVDLSGHSVLSGTLNVGSGDNTLTLQGNASLGDYLAASGSNNQVVIKDQARFRTLDAGSLSDGDVLTFDNADYTLLKSTDIQHFDRMTLSNGAGFTTGTDIALGDTTANVGEVAIDRTSSLMLTSLSSYTFDHRLTGNGLVDVQSGSQFDFGTSVGNQFSGVVQVNSQNFSLSGTNTAALMQATLSVGANNTTTVGHSTQSIGGLSVNGGTLDFGVNLPNARVCDAFIDVAGTLDTTGAGYIKINTPAIENGTSPVVDRTEGLLDQQGETRVQLVSAGQVIGGAGNLTLIDGQGSAISDSQWGSITQSQVHAANAKYDYRMATDGVNGSGLYVAYGLSQLDLLSVSDDKLVINTADSQNSRLSAQITGVGDLGISAGNGSEALILSNLENSYTGATELQTGTLILETNGALGHTSALNLAASTTLEVQGTMQTAGTLNSLSGSTLDLMGGDVSFTQGGVAAGSLTGNGDLRITGGTFSVTGANSGLMATTTVSEGAIAQLEDSQALGSGEIVSKGEVRLDGVSGTLGNNLSGAGLVSLINGSTLRLGGDNRAFAGVMTVDAGTTLTVSESEQVGGQSTIENANQLIADNQNDMTLSATVNGLGDLIKRNTGTLNLSGINHYHGDTYVTAGTVAMSADANLGDSANRTVLDGGNLQITANLTSARNVTLNQRGSVIVDSGITASMAGWDDTGVSQNSVTKAGQGTLVWTGDNSANTAEVNVTDGTLEAGSLANIGSANGVVNLGTNGSLFLHQPTVMVQGENAQTGLDFTRQLAGSGELRVDLGNEEKGFTFNRSALGGAFTGTVAIDNGSLVLDANADTVMSLATLRLGASGSTQLTGDHALEGLVFDGGEVLVGYGEQDNQPMGHLTVNSLDVSGGGHLAITTPSHLDNPMQVSGHSLFDQDDDAGDQIIAATTVTHVGTQLTVTQANGSPEAPEVIGLTQNGVLAGNAHYDYMAQVKSDGLYLSHGLTQLDSFAGASLILDNAAAADNALGAILTGEGGYSVNASGMVRIGNVASNYTGATDLNSGALALITDNSLGQTSVLNMQSGTALYFDGNRQTIGRANVAANSQVVINQGALTLSDGGVIDGELSGDGELVVTGGTLDLSADNTHFTGNTTLVSGVTARLMTAQGLGLSQVNNQGKLMFDGASGMFQSSLNGDGGEVVFTNGSDILLAADNSDYTGKFTIASGNSLTVSDSSQLGQSTVNNDGELIVDTVGLMAVTNSVSGDGQLVKRGTGTLSLDGSTVSASLTNIDDGLLLIGSSSVDAPASPVLASDVVINDSGSLGGYGNVNGNVTNAGKLLVGNSANGDGYGSFTINGHYIGNGGTVFMTTELAGDRSSTDRLVINGDSSGQSNVSVSSVRGDGAQTVDGIKLIEVGGSSEGRFTLQGRAVGGAYDYFLYQGSAADTQDGDWYLRSTKADAESDNDAQDKVLRPEASGYMANMAAAQKLFTLRLADRAGLAEDSSLWLRQVGSHTQFHDESGQSKTSANSYVVQGGGEVSETSFGESDRLGVGVMAAYGSTDSNVSSKVSGYEADGQVNGYSTGVYATWYEDAKSMNGVYADSWVQYSWLDASVSGERLSSSENYEIKGASASLESGYRMPVYQGINSDVFVTPQAQIVWNGMTADEHTESNGTRVQSDGGNSIQSRLGIRLSRESVGNKNQASNKSKGLTMYAEANWLYSSQLASATLDGTEITQAGSRNLGELRLGAEGQLNSRLSLWSSVAQQVGDEGYSDTSANLGIKLAF